MEYLFSLFSVQLGIFRVTYLVGKTLLLTSLGLVIFHCSARASGSFHSGPQGARTVVKSTRVFHWPDWSPCRLFLVQLSTATSASRELISRLFRIPVLSFFLIPNIWSWHLVNMPHSSTGWSWSWAPGCVKIKQKDCVFLPAEGKQNTSFRATWGPPFRASLYALGRGEPDDAEEGSPFPCVDVAAALTHP